MPGVTDAEYIAAAKAAAEATYTQGAVDIAITAALAFAQNKARGALADMQAELAERQVALAEEVQAHMAAFWPEETDYVNDAFGQGLHTAERIPLAVGWGQFAYEANTAGREAWLKDSRAMCMPPDRCDDARWSFQTTKSVVDTTNHALRQAEVRADSLNDRRYSRQYSALGLGQGRLQSAKNYQQVAGIVGANASGIVANTVNSGLELLGFVTHRNSPQRWTAGQPRGAYAPMMSQGQPTLKFGTNGKGDDPIGALATMSNMWADKQFVSDDMVVTDLPPLAHGRDGQGGV